MTKVEGFAAVPLAAWLLALAIVAICLRVYGRLLVRVLKGEGKVWSAPFGLPDLFVALALAGLFIQLAVESFSRKGEPPPMSSQQILYSAVFFGMVVGGIVLFLQSRKLSVVRLFGFAAMPPLRALAAGAILLAAAYPLVRLSTLLTLQWMGEKAESQQIIEFFVQAIRQNHLGQIAATVGAGVFVAPVAEEFLFRGFLYGVLRRYLGPLAAILLSSALFAVIHFNLFSLPSLFLLAVCFALAYEATGSLLVTMVMHALFNALNLGEVFYHAYLLR